MYDPLPPGGHVRKLWIGEAEAYRDHLFRLDPESRHRRFSGAVSDEIIARHAVSITDFGVVAYGFFVDGSLRGAAELRPAGTFADEAEAAFSVEAAWQSLGVGTALLKYTLLTARNRGIKRLQMQCLVENRPMQQLAKKFAAEFSFDFGSVVGEVKAQRSTALSLIREWTGDAYGALETVLDLQAQSVRAN